MLSDEVGSISHKRIIATIGSMILFVVFIITKDSHLANIIFWLVALCMGFATWDKISNR